MYITLRICHMYSVFVGITVRHFNVPIEKLGYIEGT